MFREILSFKIWRRRWGRFIRWLEDKNHVYLYGHSDGDGVFSSALLSHLLSSRDISFEVHFVEHGIKYYSTPAIFVDCSPGSILDDTIIIDHHKTRIRSRSVIHPFSIFEKRQLSCSFFIASLMYAEKLITFLPLLVAACLDGAYFEALPYIFALFRKESIRYIPRGNPSFIVQMLASYISGVILRRDYQATYSICQKIIKDRLDIEIIKGIAEYERSFADKIIEVSEKELSRLRALEKIVCLKVSRPGIHRLIIPILEVLYPDKEAFVIYRDEKDRIRVSICTRDDNLMKKLKSFSGLLALGGHKRMFCCIVKRDKVNEFIRYLDEVVE